jgi:hypothetical protein
MASLLIINVLKVQVYYCLTLSDVSSCRQQLRMRKQCAPASTFSS